MPFIPIVFIPVQAQLPIAMNIYMLIMGAGQIASNLLV